MGRHKTPGNRSKGGRKKKASTTAARLSWDYGNDRVQAKRALFDAMCIKGGKAVDQVFDAIGQLWALDFLDGHGIDDVVLRDTARDYGKLYWQRNADKAPRIGSGERASHGKSNDNDTRADLRIEGWLRDLSKMPFERDALDALVVDPWFSDDLPLFAHNLVTRELFERGRMPPVIGFPTPHDEELLAAALRALFVLVDGRLPQRWEAAA